VERVSETSLEHLGYINLLDVDFVKKMGGRRNGSSLYGISSIPSGLIVTVVTVVPKSFFKVST
jgi:hypothetical protein